MTDCNHLKIFNQVAEKSSLDIAVITGDEPHILPSIKNSGLRKIFKAIALITYHINIGIKIRLNRHKQVILIHGFSNEFLIFTYLFSLFITKNVYLLTHHNIQQAFHELPSRLILKLYSILNYKFILNESYTVLKNIGFSDKEIDKHIFLLHPVVKPEVPVFTKINSNEPKKIGLIGKLRQGKQIDSTLELLLEIQKEIDFEIILGTDNFSHFNNLNTNRIKLVNTGQKSDYQNTLQKCDIVILNYQKLKYFYRCSGVAADAIGAKTFVICPNFPLMNNQINYPTKVGISYANESQLKTVIQEALNFIENNVVLFEKHYTERSIENVAAKFIKSLEIKINLNN